MEDNAMDVYTAARIEVFMFSFISFGAGYYWSSGLGKLIFVFLVWAGLTMIKDTWNEYKFAKAVQLSNEKTLRREQEREDRDEKDRRYYAKKKS